MRRRRHNRRTGGRKSTRARPCMGLHFFVRRRVCGIRAARPRRTFRFAYFHNTSGPGPCTYKFEHFCLKSCILPASSIDPSSSAFPPQPPSRTRKRVVATRFSGTRCTHFVYSLPASLPPYSLARANRPLLTVPHPQAGSRYPLFGRTLHTFCVFASHLRSASFRFPSASVPLPFRHTRSPGPTAPRHRPAPASG